MESTMRVPQGEFTLHRHDHATDPSLRAWDAADVYALDHLHELAREGRTLVVNDAFGALTVALGATAWVDSLVAQQAIRSNAAANGVDDPDVVPASTTPAGPFDVVVVKVPRSLDLLDRQLAGVRGVMAPDAVVVGAGMTKHVHNSTIALFERHLGPTPTSLARRKARLLLPEPGCTPDPQPVSPPAEWTTPDGVRVVGLPGVFSHDRLDHGTALLLAHLPPLTGTVVDLGCGTGVIGATVAARNPDIRLVLVDESHLAVESARATCGGLDADFLVADLLEGIDDASVDAVVANPPFHAAGARTTDVAVRMIDDAHRVLRPGGRLVVVANRHLGHHRSIERRFGEAEVLGSDRRFVVLAAAR